MSIELFIIACLSLSLVVFGALAVGSYFLTRQYQDGMRRASHLTTMIEGKLHDAEGRCKVLRDELERVKIDRDSFRAGLKRREAKP